LCEEGEERNREGLLCAAIENRGGRRKKIEGKGKEKKREGVRWGEAEREEK
jgi:hypothetical protein